MSLVFQRAEHKVTVSISLSVTQRYGSEACDLSAYLDPGGHRCSLPPGYVQGVGAFFADSLPIGAQASLSA
jgi:hypothetical protein